jgi:hypothetical protein
VNYNATSRRHPSGSRTWYLLPLAPGTESSLPPMTAGDPPLCTRCDCLEIDRFSTGARPSSPPKECRDRRGLLMAQQRHGGFRPKPHIQKADCPLATKGSADAGMEVSIEDRSKSAKRSRRPLPHVP